MSTSMRSVRLHPQCSSLATVPRDIDADSGRSVTQAGNLAWTGLSMKSSCWHDTLEVDLCATDAVEPQTMSGITWVCWAPEGPCCSFWRQGRFVGLVSLERTRPSCWPVRASRLRRQQGKRWRLLWLQLLAGKRRTCMDGEVSAMWHMHTENFQPLCWGGALS